MSQLNYICVFIILINNKYHKIKFKFFFLNFFFFVSKISVRARISLSVLNLYIYISSYRRREGVVWGGGKNISAKNILKSWNVKGGSRKMGKGVSRIKYLLLLLFIYISYSNIKYLSKKKERKKNS